ncbi:hypothetical protein CR66_00815 [Campylobacter mucosalis]|uniref:DUF2157 domain-containing protein n=1 Tax=Campylobacter mucosalis TaxID=202 RepID=UPI0004D5501D|nr:DUF2157 domain-containing protein [Campylobacter mucosalis]KEA46428.1 hypothetical protein CR66_00815 [Campylobacter mucosalis]QKF63086.1 DUF2157 domain-containing membrane protein [Campylobacter mucosalis]
MKIWHRNFLKEELLKWRDEGIIDERTSLKIASRYEINLNEVSTNILTLIAYFFFGLSLFVLVGANWEEIPDFIRTFLLISLTALLNFAGFLSYQKRKFNQATALLMLGSIVFCASVALISQIYHIDKHLPNGILFCALGVALLGFSFKDSLVSAFSLIIAIAWVFFSFEYIHKIEPFFAVFILLGIAVLRHSQGQLLSFALLISTYIFLIFFKVELLWFNYILATLSYLLFVASISLFLAKTSYKIVAKIFYQSAILGIVVILFCLQIEGYYLPYDFEISSYLSTLFIIFTALSLIFAFYYQNLYLLCGAILLGALPFLLNFGVSLALISSIVCVVLAIILIKQGSINYGITLIFTTALIRYVELIGDYFGASLLFLGFAVLLLVIARKRRVK